MIWIALGKWSSASGPWCIRRRIYRNGLQWTPFVTVHLRYTTGGLSDDEPSWEDRQRIWEVHQQEKDILP